MNVGVVGNSRYQNLRGLLARLAAVAPKLGFTLSGEPKLADLWPAPVSNLDGQPLDLLLTFGGDGTLLRGARLTASQEVAILGVNIGRVGFLATATPELFPPTTGTVPELSEATLVRITEAVVTEAAAQGRAVLVGRSALRVAIDSDEVGQYSADGIIVATQTGSTAYSLSAGGPVVVPGVDAIVITAICPHTLSVRPIVAPGHANIVIEVVPPWTDDVLVSYDGQAGTTLESHHRVLVRQAPTVVRLIRLGKEGFFARLRRKLQWGDLSDRERP